MFHALSQPPPVVSGVFEDRWDPNNYPVETYLDGQTSVPWDGGQSFVWAHDGVSPGSDKWLIQDIYPGAISGIGGDTRLITPDVGSAISHFAQVEMSDSGIVAIGPAVAMSPYNSDNRHFYVYQQNASRIRVRARDPGNVNVLNVDHGTSPPFTMRLEATLVGGVGLNWSLRAVVIASDLQEWEGTGEYAFSTPLTNPIYVGMGGGAGGFDTAWQRFKGGAL